MTKTLRVLAGLISVAVLTAVPASGQPNVHGRPGSGRFTYVGGDQFTYVPPVTNAANRAGVAPLGHFTVVPAGPTLTVTVDDVAATDGQGIHLRLWQAGKRLFSGCTPVRTESTITGVVAGERVYVFMDGGAYDFGCSAFATTGVVTVSGLE